MMITKMILPLVAIIGILFYAHKSFIRNILNPYKLPNWIVLFLDFFILFLASFRLIFKFAPSLFRYPFFRYFLTASYTCLGITGLFVLILMFLDLETLSFRKILPKNRRDFLKKTILGPGILTSGTITGVGFYQSFNPEITTIPLQTPLLFPHLKGLRIVQLSDIHLGTTLQKKFAEKIVHMTNQLDADIIVITGDLIDGTVDVIGDDVGPLKNLRSKLGIYYVTGNHEYYWNAEDWIKKVKSLGFIHLDNSHISLIHNQGILHICGVPDKQATQFHFPGPDFKLASKNIPSHEYKILLSHQPVTWDQAIKEGYQLQLSGHTHGGQGFPWNLIVKIFQPYIQGLYEKNGQLLYVNRGTGFWGPPNRFLINSEITLLTYT